ncbi:MAG: PDZ domain-containing protein [Caldilinea sp. CFX5]|nr:PDZ domain-containing protein [Caldilinea sp. CFX5]
MQNRFTNLLFLFLISLTWFVIGWALHSFYRQATATTAQTPTTLIESARTIILNQQLASTAVTAEHLTYAAIRGMVRQTGDAKAVLFTPPASRYYAEDLAGATGVSGVVFDVIDHKIVILDAPADRPAAQAGIRPGDIVLGIDGVRFDENTSGDEVSLLFHGAVGSTATVLVQRGDQLMTYQVVRAEFPAFTTQRLHNDIGYIKQPFFPHGAEVEMKKHLQTLVDQQIRALIWDLRDSRGGSMQATGAILNYFIADGVFYHAVFKDGEQESFAADGSAPFADLPLVVLVDGRTYSSSEMAALTLLEHQRAVIIGAQTEGKGTIQTTIALDEEHLLRVTIAKWLSPSGLWIQDQGITPQFTVVDDPATTTDEVLAFATNYVEQTWPATAKQ